MTVEEIKAKLHTELSDRAWLQEIALQLALLNQQRSMPDQAYRVIQQEVVGGGEATIAVKRGPGRPRKVAA